MKRKIRRYIRKQKSRKKPLLYLLSVLVIILIFSVIFTHKTKPHTPTLPNTGIVTTPYVAADGTQLVVNGHPYQFTGVNAYNIASDNGVNAGCGGQINNLDAFFSQLRPNSMVRMWAFQASMGTNVNTKQTDWTGIDRVVAAAQKDNVKLILVLADQAGTCDDGHWKDQSWYAGGYTQAFDDAGTGLSPLPYLDYVKLIVARYKDSTAVAMWEPVNEPEASNCNGATGTGCYKQETCNEPDATKALRSFFDVVGGTIKSIDKNHLVSSGVIGNGQCGAQYEDYQYVHASPGIDVASYHDYGNDDQPMPGDPYNGLQKRLDQMKILDKPLIVGETGIQAKDNTPGCISYQKRRDELKAKMDAQFKAGIAGFIPWDLTDGTSAICNYDIVNNDPTIALLHTYPVSMGTYTDIQPPTSPSNVTITVLSPTQFRLSWIASTDNVGVVRYDIFRNDTYFTSTTGTSITLNSTNLTGIHTYFVKGKDAAGNNSGSSNRVTGQ